MYRRAATRTRTRAYARVPHGRPVRFRFRFRFQFGAGTFPVAHHGGRNSWRAPVKSESDRPPCYPDLSHIARNVHRLQPDSLPLARLRTCFSGCTFTATSLEGIARGTEEVEEEVVAAAASGAAHWWREPVDRVRGVKRTTTSQSGPTHEFRDPSGHSGRGRKNCKRFRSENRRKSVRRYR